MAMNGNNIDILVDTNGAVYPLTVDPLASTPDWTAEGNQEGAYYGFSVSTAGDVNGDGYSDVIVGAPYYDTGQSDAGAAFVFHGSSTGLSTLDWFVFFNQADANYGFSVSTAGDVNGDGYADVIVGSPKADNGQTDEGRAFIYHGSSTGLSTVAAWTADGKLAEAQLGYSVSTAGDVNGDVYADVIVGACKYSNGQTFEGRTFVFHGGSDGLSETAGWTAESDQVDAHFGGSVSTAGDVNGDGYADVIVGAPGYDNGQTNEGRAVVYHGSSTGLGSTAEWIAESNQEGAEFGISVSTPGT